MEKSGKSGQAVAVCILTAAFTTGLACTPKSVPSKVESSPTPSPSPITPLAHLGAFNPDVTYRRSNELIWQPAENDQGFFRYDAVQTHERANAKIDFSNGSELDLGEKSLVIINPSGADHPDRDQAVVRAGSLKSKTKRELWIFTSAALFKIKAKSPQKPAQASLAIHEGKELKVEVDEGSATLTQKTAQGKIQTRELVVHQVVTLPAPKANDNFGTNEWVEEIPVGTTKLPSVKPLTFTVESPRDRAEVAESEILVRGRVSGVGGKVLVNGVAAQIDRQFQFQVSAPLELGANIIVVQLIRPDGTSAFHRLNILRK